MTEPTVPPRISSSDVNVGQLVATALDAFLSAAALHLGEATHDGSRLEAGDPVEAYLALLSASALLDHLGPLMSDDLRVPFQAALSRLAKLYAERNPDRQTPAPIRPVSSLKGLVTAAWADLQRPGPTARTAPARPGSGPLGMPGTGLPARGSGPLFPA